jgi:hypothetical protein
MHPDISAIVNALVYEGILRDGDSVKKADADDSLLRWHAKPQYLNVPVTLLDTSALAAWNTGVDPSRINLLSAFITCELASHMLSNSRPILAAGKPKRILLICPYRPHARLLQLLLPKDGLGDEVAANTVHSFQGSEADVVILDLVVDKPHFRTNLTTRVFNENITRLLNVAMTRAKRRLVIVGDFAWLHAKSGGAFVGGTLLPWLQEKYEVLPAQLPLMTCRATNSSALESQTIIPSKDVRRLFAEDVANLRRRIVLYSPSLCLDAVEATCATLRSTASRGIGTFVVCRPIAEYGARRQAEAQQAEALLTGVGARIVHKAWMLEKLAVLESEVLWCGSVGLLDEVHTDAIVFRGKNHRLVKECSDVFRIEDLIAPYAMGPHLCPICSLEMLAAEARGGMPYYWRCTENGCYSRSITDPPLVDGMITFNCRSH